MRPDLKLGLDYKVFLKNYYLKDELVAFLKENHISAFGSKEELTDRIAKYLQTGEKVTNTLVKRDNRYLYTGISLDTKIEKNIRFTEIHRAFFEREIGNDFSFNVEFQKWLKEHYGKTYKDAIVAYYKIQENKKKTKSSIGSQFEYNKYVRAFFEDNKDKSFNDAITCWKFKKSLEGTHVYERSDLEALNM